MSTEKPNSVSENIETPVIEKEATKPTNNIEPVLEPKAKEQEIVPKKKASPFLFSEVKKEVTVEEENTSTKRQHDQIDKITKDKTIFNASGKLYFKSERTQKMETRGEGKFLIMQDDAKMHKLIMIRDLVMLKGCNHFISPVSHLVKATQAKNSWIWTALYDQSDAEKKEEKTLYFATFKDEETSNLFEKKYKEAQVENLKVIEAKNALKEEIK